MYMLRYVKVRGGRSSSGCSSPKTRPGLSVNPSGQPDVEEDQKDSQKEEQPHTPAHSGPLRHAEHTVHVPPDADAGVIEGVVQRLGQAGAIADFVPYGDGQLALSLAVSHTSQWSRAYIFEHPHFGSDPLDLGVILGFQVREDGIGVMAPFDTKNVSLRLLPTSDTLPHSLFVRRRRSISTRCPVHRPIACTGVSAIAVSAHTARRLARRPRIATVGVEKGWSGSGIALTWESSRLVSISHSSCHLIKGNQP